MRRIMGMGVVALGAVFTTIAWAQQPEAPAKPNLVIILADDLGYGDVRCYNPEQGKIPTPNIDRLAAQGMRFTDGHSSAGGCTPSRYALLTGRYDWRSRCQRGVYGGFGGPPLIATNRLTVAGLAKQQGYRTACIGKWHVGWNWPIGPRDQKLLGLETVEQIARAHRVELPAVEKLAADGFYKVGPIPGYNPPAPDDRQLAAWRQIFAKPIGGGPTAVGFDFYYGVDAPGYPPHCFIENDRTVGIPSEFLPARDLLPAAMMAEVQGPTVKGWDFYEVTPSMIRRAIGYVQDSAKSGQPFLLFLPLPGPHQPWAVSEAWRGRSGLSLYADGVMEMDARIGELLGALDRTGAADNTLVMVLSDNGYSPYGVAELIKKGQNSSGPWRGYKATPYEGGTRTPFIVRWPAIVKPGSVCNQLVNQVDIMATFAEILDVKLPGNAGEDSFSFLPLLKGRDSFARESVVNHSGQGGYGIRKGPWKLILEVDGRGSVPVQLYNLADDPGETKNLAAGQPEKVAELRALMAKLVDDGRSTPGPRQPNDTQVLWQPRGRQGLAIPGLGAGRPRPVAQGEPNGLTGGGPPAPEPGKDSDPAVPAGGRQDASGKDGKDTGHEKN